MSFEKLRRMSSSSSAGDPAATPKPPTFPTGWSLGQPDMVEQVEQQLMAVVIRTAPGSSR